MWMRSCMGMVGFMMAAAVVGVWRSLSGSLGPMPGVDPAAVAPLGLVVSGLTVACAVTLWRQEVVPRRRELRDEEL